MIRNIKTTATIIALVLIVLFNTSCTKETVLHVEKKERTIRFVLYTEKDFSKENGNIVFSVFIREANNRNVFDSTFAVMKVKDIPSHSNKIVIEKKVMVDSLAQLRAGFVYTLENVGYSWRIETSEPGDLFKEVNYSFQ